MQPKILASGPFKPEQIKVFRNENTSRKTNPDIENRIEESWVELQERARLNDLLLFNGLSYRLDSFEVDSENNLNLNLSEFDFKTRRSLEMISDEIEPLGYDYFGAGLAVGSLIRTSDDYYVFGERSGKTMSSNKVD